MTDGHNASEQQRLEAHRLSAQLRRVIEKLVLVRAPADQLATAAEAARAFADQLEGLPARRWYETHEGFSESANAGSPVGMFDLSPIMGLANPLASPLQLEIAEDFEGNLMAVGKATFNAAYEGPPGCVHGGILASVFDEVLGFANGVTGNPAVTGTLTIKYRKPTPLYQPLRFEGRCVRVSGRKVFTKGACFHEGILTAEAEAIFVKVDMSHIAESLGANVRRAANTPTGGPLDGPD